MKTNEVLNNVHNNQLVVVKKGALLVNNNYAKVAGKTFEMLTKTVVLGLVLTVVNIIA